MKCLSVRQPWAWAIVSGAKDVENRTWRPSPRLLKAGDSFLIHAGKKFDLPGYRWILANHAALGLSMEAIPSRDEFTLGAIVGAAIFGGTVADDSASHPRTAPAVLNSPWFFGPVGWLITEALDMAEPIPCKGRLGLFDFEEAMMDRPGPGKAVGFRP